MSLPRPLSLHILRPGNLLNICCTNLDVKNLLLTLPKGLLCSVWPPPRLFYTCASRPYPMIPHSIHRSAYWALCKGLIGEFGAGGWRGACWGLYQVNRAILDVPSSITHSITAEQHRHLHSFMFCSIHQIQAQTVLNWTVSWSFSRDMENLQNCFRRNSTEIFMNTFVSLTIYLLTYLIHLLLFYLLIYLLTYLFTYSFVFFLLTYLFIYLLSYLFTYLAYLSVLLIYSTYMLNFFLFTYFTSVLTFFLSYLFT